MEFQILNSNNVAVVLNQLDKEAAAFWGVEYNEDHWAKFGSGLFGTDWYNWIGYTIARQPEKGKQEWGTIIGSVCETMAICKSSTADYFDSLESIKPILDLIFYWKSKGYIPVTL